MELFFDYKNTKKGTEHNENGTIGGKKEWERNDLAEGPCSRKELNEAQ